MKKTVALMAVGVILLALVSILFGFEITARGQAVTISIPTEPDPEWAEKFRRLKDGRGVLIEKPILRLNISDVLLEDLYRGRAATFHVGGEFHADIAYLPQEGRKDHLIFILGHPDNRDPVFVYGRNRKNEKVTYRIDPGKTLQLNLDLLPLWRIAARRWE